MRAHLSKIVILLRRVANCMLHRHDEIPLFLRRRQSLSLMQMITRAFTKHCIRIHDGTPYGDYTDQAESHYADKLDMHEWDNPPLTS